MKRPLTLATISLAFVAFLATLALRTSELERVSMLERDGEIEAAARLANSLYDQGDRRSALLARVFELNHLVGNPQRADRALREYLAGTPDNPRTLRKAAEFFELEQDLEGTFSALVSLVRVAPSGPALEKLARLYRLHGRFAEEESLLLNQRQVLGAELLARLGGLLAQKGEVAAAVDVLRSADDRFPGEQEQFSSLLFDLLVGRGDRGEALTRASRWAQRDTDPYARMPMILRFAEVGARKEAIALASVPLANSEGASDTPKAATIFQLLSRGHVDLAGEVVEQFSDPTPKPERKGAIAHYVTIAVAAGSPGEVTLKAHRLLQSTDLSQKKIGIALASVLFERWGFAGLGPLRAHLSPQVAALDPLFAAQVALAENNPTGAGFYVLQAELSETDETRTSQWLSLAKQSLRPADLALEMMGRRQEGKLPSMLLAEMQLAIQKAGIFAPLFDPFATASAPGQASSVRSRATP